MHRVLAAARREERGFVDEIREIGAGHAWCRRRELFEIDVAGERNLARVDLQNLDAALLIWRMDDDLPIESPWPKQRRIEHVGPVGGGEHDDALVSGEAVHLREDLIQRLFALVVSPE